MLVSKNNKDGILVSRIFSERLGAVRLGQDLLVQFLQFRGEGSCKVLRA